jgi:hypothetical protein
MDERLLHHEGCGLMTQHHLRGLLLDIEKKLGRSVLAVQKIPSGCLWDFPTKVCIPSHKNCKEYPDFRGQYVAAEPRDVSDEFPLTYNPLCRKIHEEVPFEKNCGELPNDCRCAKLNCLAAAYFLGNAEDKKDAVDKLRNLKLEEYIAKNHVEEASYITYICPYSRLMECAFEIKYCETSAVLICGQFLVDDDTKESKENIRLHNDLSQKYGVEPTSPTKSDDMNKNIKEIFKQIANVGNHLNSIYKNHCNHFTNKHVEEMMKNISDSNNFSGYGSTNMEFPLSTIERQYEALKGKVWTSIRNFADKANIQVSCFMTENLNMRDGTDIVNQDGNRISTDIIYTRKDNDYMDIENGPPLLVDMALLDIKELKKDLLHLQAYIKELRRDYTHLMFSKDKQLFNFLILVKINSKIKKDIAKEISKKTYEYFFKIVERATRGRALGFFYEYQGEAIKRFNTDLRHELGQSNIGFLTSMKSFAREQEEGDRSAHTIIRNAFRFAYTTMLRTNVSRYMWGTPEPTYMKFLPYEKFLFKWADVYYDNMDSRDIQFRMFKPTAVSDRYRPHMYADPDMIEQVAYNLTNNAMKYSLPGTTVTLDCRLNERGDMYQLMVTNYGLPIKDDEYERIFERGFQGHNATDVCENHSDKDSKGIGLALSKEIAEKHDRGTLELIHEKVSDLCIPYCFIYKKQYNNPLFSPLYDLLRTYYHISDLRSKISEEIERLKKNRPDDWNELTATEFKKIDENISGDEVMGMIGKGVVKYVFVLSIPHRGDI